MLGMKPLHQLRTSPSANALGQLERARKIARAPDTPELRPRHAKIRNDLLLVEQGIVRKVVAIVNHSSLPSAKRERSKAMVQNFPKRSLRKSSELRLYNLIANALLSMGQKSLQRRVAPVYNLTN